MPKPLVVASARRSMGPWTKGAVDAVHETTYELSVMVSGCQHVRLDERCASVRAPQVTVIPPGRRHSCWTTDRGMEECGLHLDAAQLDSTRPGLKGGLYDLPEPSAPLVDRLAAAIVSGGDALTRAAVEVVEQIASHSPCLPVIDARLSRVVAALDGDLDHSWRVDEMARVAGLSPAHFSRCFREAFGEAPMEFLLQRRVTRARWLMETSEMSLTRIAMAVGFGSSSRLTEAFRKRFGIPPSQWRSQHRQGPMSVR